MRKEMYKHRNDAINYAEEYAKENGGWVLASVTWVTNNNDFDYVDRELANESWSGETPAFQVVDKDDNLIALFGYMEED